MIRLSFPFLAGMLFAVPALALELEVENELDAGAGSLRDAIQQAVASVEDDTITFDASLSGGEIFLETGSFPVTGPGKIAVTAEGLALPVRLSVFGLNRHFEIVAGSELELVNLILSDGIAPSGSTGSDGPVPTAGGDGEHGGSIHNEGTLTLRSCIVESNAAGNGGSGGHKTGAAAGSSGAGGEGGKGGAIYSTGASAAVRIEQSILRHNDAGTGGSAGRLEVGAAGSIGVAGSGGSGGAIYLEGGTLEVIESTIEANGAGFGGIGGEDKNDGVGGAGGRGGDGGGIALADAAVRIEATTVKSNTAGFGGIGGNDPASNDDVQGPGGDGGDGGGMHILLFGDVAGAPQISDSLFHANEAGIGRSGGTSAGSNPGGTAGGDGGSGGAIFLVGGDDAIWRMQNSTFLLNFAGDGGGGGDGGPGGNGGDAGDGGGLAFARETSDYRVELTHLSVFSNNAGLPGNGGNSGGTTGAASSGGGIWVSAGGTDLSAAPGLKLANCAVANNDADAQSQIDGDFATEGNNLTSGDPEVSALSDNGGLTETVAPVIGSPLLDGGGTLAVPLATDQRGEFRPFNGLPDLGAFEGKFQADARIGAKGNPATHRIDNVYTASGAGQVQAVRLRNMRKSLFFVSVQNDGEIGDPLALWGSRANKTLRLSAFNLSSGGSNVTAALVAGITFDEIAPAGLVVFRMDVRARSKKRRARQNLVYAVRSAVASPPDVVRAKISQRIVRKRR